MEIKTGIDLQSLVDTHERPFVIIDHDFTIVAVNKAYEQEYRSTREQMVGRHCYQVSHNNDRPCFESGEECPHQHIYQEGTGCCCLHIHYDSGGRAHRVQINAYPLSDGAGHLYLGEAIQELSQPDEGYSGQARMVGQSTAFMRMLAQLKLAASADAPVLLEGETGTGKDLAAHFIHEHSRRTGRPFLTLDCTVLTDSLFEAEVFGHERGAFTGSVGEKEGLFELVDGGTLFLDEIGEIAPSLQAKLLRVLETGEYRRVGGRRTRHTNARIICATNRNLARDVAAKTFREDLYYRIDCLHIQVPSLRERLDDVPLIAEALLESISQTMGRSCWLSVEAIQALKLYVYPGNVRELRNILSVAAAHSSSGKLEAREIVSVIECMRSRHVTAAADLPGVPVIAAATQTSTNDLSLQELEAQHIAELLKRHQGNRRQAAEALGVSERTVYRKLKRYGLE